MHTRLWVEQQDRLGLIAFGGNQSTAEENNLPRENILPSQSRIERKRHYRPSLYHVWHLTDWKPGEYLTSIRISKQCFTKLCGACKMTSFWSCPDWRRNGSNLPISYTFVDGFHYSIQVGKVFVIIQLMIFQNELIKKKCFLNLTRYTASHSFEADRLFKRLTLLVLHFPGYIPFHIVVKHLLLIAYDCSFQN